MNGLLKQAMSIVESYDKGNGSYNGKLSSFTFFDSDIDWLIAVGLFEISKMDYSDISELQRMKAVSIKHSTLLAKGNTGKFDFTALLGVCDFINKIDTNTQQFTFKRETSKLKINLHLLEIQLTFLGLELITEEQTTRSGGKLTSYFYDVTTTTKEV